MIKLTKKEKEIREKLEGIFTAICSSYEEQSAADKILEDASKIIRITEDVEEGTPLQLVARQALQDAIIAREDAFDYETSPFEGNGSYEMYLISF